MHLVMGADKNKPTLADLAQKYGVSRQTVSAWKKQDIDVYDEEAVQAYVATRHSDGGVPLTASETNDRAGLLKARRRRAELAAEREQISLDVEKGKLVSMANVKGEAQASGFFLREVVMRWFRNELPPQLGGLETCQVAKKLEEAAHEILTELAEGWKSAPEHFKRYLLARDDEGSK